MDMILVRGQQLRDLCVQLIKYAADRGLHTRIGCYLQTVAFHALKSL